MSSGSKFCSLATTAACASLAVAGLISPALAQNRTAWLNTGGSTSVSGYFLEGEAIYATCDSDCADIDLYLYDSVGTMVAADDAPDAVPIVYAPYTGDFVIQITMPACYADSCGVGISSAQGF